MEYIGLKFLTTYEPILLFDLTRVSKLMVLLALL